MTDAPSPLWRSQPVGIVGMGLIGGSIGLDLGRLGAEVRALVHRPVTAQRALARGLAGTVSTDPAVLEGCGLVILAVPLDRLLDPAPEWLAAIPQAAVVTDVGSVKGSVLERWQRLVDRFVASHPMAGTAEAGVEAGLPGLFAGRPWVATPNFSTDPEALAAVRDLALALGAQWLTCDPRLHDQAVALISHLPVLAGAALLQVADGAAQEGGIELPALVRALASTGFADTTRVGGGNPELGSLMARTNRAALLTALGRYREGIEALEQQLQEGHWQDLQATLAQAQALRPQFVAASPNAPAPD
ncbi:prephenate/arogenate dehydrogenase [Cyanobium sp. WAJ14-Wanaka]|uniref:prephenate/arogenate dehydrogenase n=1 Tax=Cyanobium sp. WAJ14-Wanaka TaxID=2823725 RepID=UPI0020CD7121|nr:prephenate/arogenate dehydrogenase [Cyanobium sp. WAJ14-Wanaka]MCP9776019.1 prephenate/arogenate dehydrogenase [Cyanobium sp. WAJ14-Wanaka]